MNFHLTWNLCIYRAVETFHVWRSDWSDLQPREIISKVMQGNIRSNWISGEMTGCVGIDDDSYAFIHAFSWKTLGEVYIKTNDRVLSLALSSI
jgi:hypothetical protein